MRKFVFVLICCVFALCSCATRTRVEYVDKEVVKYVTQVQHDTLINNTHDSIYVTEKSSGDTIYVTKYVEHVQYRDRIVVKADTLWRDSLVYKDKETRVEVKKTPKWCYLSLVVAVLCIAMMIVTFKIK